MIERLGSISMKNQNYVVIKLKSEKGHFFELKYKLFENSFVNKWTKIVSEYLKNDMKSIFTTLYGGDFFDEKVVREDIVKTIAEINSYKKKWITLQPYEGMDQTFLTALHDEFERIDNLIHYDQFKRPRFSDWPMAIYFF
jgi:hypothetical protein